MRRLIVLTAGLIGVTFMAACGVPNEGEFEPIAGGDVQFELNQTTTPTTIALTTIPATTIDAATSTSEQATTSTILTERVQIYFVAGNQLKDVSSALAAPATPPQVLASLLEGPPAGDVGTGLRSTIPRGVEITVTRDRGTAIIDLPLDLFDTVVTRDQRLVFAQLVLTIGRLGAIGQVQFTQGGGPAPVIKGDGTTTEPGETVTVFDYEQLLTGAVPPETTSATTTVPAPAEAPVPPASATTMPIEG